MGAGGGGVDPQDQESIDKKGLGSKSSRAEEPEPQGAGCFSPLGAGATPKNIGGRSRQKYTSPVPVHRR